MLTDYHILDVARYLVSMGPKVSSVRHEMLPIGCYNKKKICGIFY